MFSDEVGKPLSPDQYQEYENDHWRVHTKRKRRGKGLRKLKNRADRPDDKSIRKYIEDRVKKLIELYDKYEPPFEMVTDYDDPRVSSNGRHSYGMVEMNLEEGVSPFELEDFNDQMPKLIDYLEGVEDE
jgi:molecular chaperone GrpE (heat shock protein)|tara:strand:- start:317 stop:703 length:387 start_codon:yes stop_codon:yes gene_type:complete